MPLLNLDSLLLTDSEKKSKQKTKLPGSLSHTLKKLTPNKGAQMTAIQRIQIRLWLGSFILCSSILLNGGNKSSIPHHNKEVKRNSQNRFSGVIERQIGDGLVAAP